MPLIDADVCIDLLREFAPALEWLASVTEELVLPGFVAIELITGCDTNDRLRKTQKFIKQFALAWPSEIGMNRAVSEFAPLRVAHGLGGLDALIAATAIERGDLLYTFNMKHFRTVPSLQIAEPYVK